MNNEDKSMNKNIIIIFKQSHIKKCIRKLIQKYLIQMINNLLNNEQIILQKKKLLMNKNCYSKYK